MEKEYCTLLEMIYKVVELHGESSKDIVALDETPFPNENIKNILSDIRVEIDDDGSFSVPDENKIPRYFIFTSKRVYFIYEEGEFYNVFYSSLLPSK